ncbi:unnamed protein product [Linum tenue]|uniref:RNase H type-1 domain-containing protein n=1 Tax=Linum tenue TaxID=586396 RepID=A0AAV0QMI6_9ROSI|nr:unnamed protein product [Linum tenue]
MLAGGGVGLGAVIRDSSGRFIAVAVKKVRGNHCVDLAEALAPEFGIQLANRLGCVRISLEVDSLNLVRHLQKEDEAISELGVICRSILQKLKQPGGSGGIISHVRRETNNAAHIMAHSESRWDMREVWLDRAPIFLLDQLRLDDVTIELI